MKAFTNATIFTGEALLRNKALLVTGNKIIDIIDDSALPEDCEAVDCEGGYLSAGLTDLQIYGGGGYLFSSSLTAASLHAIADDLVKKGTTRFMIALATNSFDVFKEAVRIVQENPHPAILGVHLEGPYINPLKKGAHIEKYIKQPDLAELASFLDFASGTVKMMTVAPEVCDKNAIDLLLKHNVIISAGHSNATFAQGEIGFDIGIRAATHLFNAMSSFHHRDPGLPGAIFLDNRVCSSIIPDGIHVSFEAVKIAIAILKERLFFITDAVEEVREGEYIHIRKNDRFELPDGTLSGSALTMPKAVKNGVDKIGLSVEESLKMATLYPAKLAGLGDEGKIHAGYKANLACFSKDLELNFSVLEGEVRRS